jgi:hypothetical protein
MSLPFWHSSKSIFRVVMAHLAMVHHMFPPHTRSRSSFNARLVWEGIRRTNSWEWLYSSTWSILDTHVFEGQGWSINCLSGIQETARNILNLSSLDLDHMGEGEMNEWMITITHHISLMFWSSQNTLSPLFHSYSHHIHTRIKFRLLVIVLKSTKISVCLPLWFTNFSQAHWPSGVCWTRWTAMIPGFCTSSVLCLECPLSNAHPWVHTPPSGSLLCSNKISLARPFLSTLLKEQSQLWYPPRSMFTHLCIRYLNSI